MSQLWKQIHTRALNYKGENDSKFLQSWSAQIPRYTSGCKCKEFWLKWKTANPPTFKPTDAYFAWTVKAHNAVNQKLGKKILTVTEAKKLY